ncbi:MAG: hypothetical protein ABR521_05845 [Gaiellaceae bacterium]
MPDPELWIPLVDEPIGALVAGIEESDPELTRLVSTPRRLLAFRTFAYVRVGILLGRMLMEQGVGAHDESETWVDVLLRDPVHRDRIESEIRAVAREVAADERLDGDTGHDDGARERFRVLARKLER